MKTSFEEAYAKLNKEQQHAVDTIEGPVMVIAGPGTGKTQVLSLRIATILKKTDVGASAVLCLTFTRSGVVAMKKRLMELMGAESNKVVVSTFHGFAQRLVEKHYELLGFNTKPELLDETQTVFLMDELLHAQPWKHLRPRSNPAMYFNDITSLISLFKREHLSPEEVIREIHSEIDELKNDPASISSRGETKGQLKKEIQHTLESLEKTAEVVDFYKLYESYKHERGLMDYDDVLTYAVQLVTDYEDVRAEIMEQYQYVLVDEHQDSSGIQNAFLIAVWSEYEKPNIFVVGDDRQLIYGFGGASMNHFVSFLNHFSGTELITLVHNYRSTSPILDLADTLLSSELAQGKLMSNHHHNHDAQRVTLAEYQYSRDEIIAAGLYFKKQMDAGVSPHECALLVPKNNQVKSAVHTLTSLGIPVSGSSTESLFAAREYRDLKRVFQCIIHPYDPVALAESLFDVIAHIPPLEAHAFLKSLKTKNLSLEHLITYGNDQGMFAGGNPIVQWGKKIQMFIEVCGNDNLATLVSKISNDLLVNDAKGHEQLVRSVEVARTMIHLALTYQEKNPHATLIEFLEYLNRLESYGARVPVAVIGGHQGVQVMTLHGSKGLEFEHVWIAHMNESTLMSQKRGGFTTPKSIAEKQEKKNELDARREVYVAITRAKSFCTLSYASQDLKGAPLERAVVLGDIPETLLIRKTMDQTTEELREQGIEVYTKYEPPIISGDDREALQLLVKNQYTESNVSVTLLNNFFECPWKWYFRNLLQLPDVKGQSLIFGSVVHSVLETLLQDKKVPSEKMVEQLVRASLEKEGAEEKDVASLTDQGVVCIMRFIEQSFKNLAPDRKTERSLSYRDPAFPHLSFYGEIDLTERFPDGSVTVTDFKTGSRSGAPTGSSIEKLSPEGRMSDYVRQLAMYSFLIRGVEKGTDVVVSKLYFLEAPEKDKHKVYATHINDEHIALLCKDIADYQSLIESGDWMSQVCHFKPFGTSSTECEYCKRAREVYGK